MAFCKIKVFWRWWMKNITKSSYYSIELCTLKIRSWSKSKTRGYCHTAWVRRQITLKRSLRYQPITPSADLFGVASAVQLQVPYQRIRLSMNSVQRGSNLSSMLCHRGRSSAIVLNNAKLLRKKTVVSARRCTSIVFNKTTEVPNSNIMMAKWLEVEVQCSGAKSMTVMEA